MKFKHYNTNYATRDGKKDQPISGIIVDRLINFLGNDLIFYVYVYEEDGFQLYGDPVYGQEAHAAHYVGCQIAGACVLYKSAFLVATKNNNMPRVILEKFIKNYLAKGYGALFVHFLSGSLTPITPIKMSKIVEKKSFFVQHEIISKIYSNSNSLIAIFHF